MNIENQYVKLNVEKYGGMLCAPWFDRPLSVAGRIIVKDGNRLTTKLINVDRDLLMIPNLAIHMNREVNDGYKYNIQKDMLPLYRMSNSGKAFKEMIAEEAGVSVDQIKGMDPLPLQPYGRYCMGLRRRVYLLLRVLMISSAHSHPQWLS